MNTTNKTPIPAGEPQPFRRIRFMKYPPFSLDGLRKVELVEGTGNTDIFFLTYTAGGKIYERFSDVSGMTAGERKALLSFIGRYARTQAIRRKGKPRGRSQKAQTGADQIDPANLIDLDRLVIKTPPEV